MKQLWFEIVRLRDERYSWVLVEAGPDQRRLLLRSHRDYRSRKRVRRAIGELAEVFETADVRDEPGFLYVMDLPHTHFALTPKALPLIVAEPLARRDRDRGRGRGRRFRNRDRHEGDRVRGTRHHRQKPEVYAYEAEIAADVEPTAAVRAPRRSRRTGGETNDVVDHAP